LDKVKIGRAEQTRLLKASLSDEYSIWALANKDPAPWVFSHRATEQGASLINSNVETTTASVTPHPSIIFNLRVATSKGFAKPLMSAMLLIKLPCVQQNGGHFNKAKASLSR
jgi:uncharacterized protein YbdZ (MbtH family)